MKNNIDSQLISEMTEIRSRNIVNNTLTLEAIMTERPEDFSGITSVDRLQDLAKEKLWRLIWLYLRQGHTVKGMNEGDLDMILNPLYFIRSKIREKENETLSQSIVTTCINSSEIIRSTYER